MGFKVYWMHIYDWVNRLIPGVAWDIDERAEVGPGPYVVYWDWEFCPLAASDNTITVFIWNNGKWLTIKCPASSIRLPGGMLWPDDPQINKMMRELRASLNSLIFGKANLAYFIQGNDGRRSIVYRRRPLYWKSNLKHLLPVVHWDELTFLRPAQGMDNVEVIWNGQQCMCLRNCSHMKLIATQQIVDLQLAKDEISLAYLENQMKGD